MITELLKICCGGLFVAAVGFLILEVKVSFHKSFIFFAVSIMLLSVFSGLDLWFKPMISNNIAIIKIQHIVFCFLPPTIMNQLLAFSGAFKRAKLLYYLPSLVIASMFIGDIMIYPENGKLILSGNYNLIFMTYFAITAIGITGYCISRVSKVKERKIFLYHLFALLILGLCGILDFVSLYSKKYLLAELPSYSIIGTILFGFILLYIFTDRLIDLIRENRKLYLKLQYCYSDLEKARSLIAIGKAPAIINHETRNHLFSIQFLIEKLKAKTVDNSDQELISNVMRHLNNLYHLNYEILDFSRKKVMSENLSFDIIELVRSVAADFTDTRFRWLDFEQSQIIYGDKMRIKYAFSTLFSFSTSNFSRELKVKFQKDRNVILILIDDDSKTLCQKKEAREGNYDFVPDNEQERLDISMIRYIVEGNGGHVTIISKEAMKSGTSGLLFYITFPNYAESPELFEKVKDNVVLIKDGLKDLDKIIQIFNNVFVNPHIVQFLDDKPDYLEKNPIIMGSYKSVKHLLSTTTGRKHPAYIISEGNSHIQILNELLQPVGILSEHLILNEDFIICNPE